MNNNQQNGQHYNNQQDTSGTKSSEWNQGSSGGQSAGAATQRKPGEGESPAADAYKNETGDPGRTPGAAEGVEDFQKTGNE